MLIFLQNKPKKGSISCSNLFLKNVKDMFDIEGATSYTLGG